MSMPAPQPAYNVDAPPVIAQGLSYNQEQLEKILQGPVKAILQDESGKEDIRLLLSSVLTTDFEKDGLEQLFTEDQAPQNWRVGEAIAEAFVADDGPCHFPWPTGRDLKNPNSSPAGCDLTGFQPVDDEALPFRFAFGEVKTSEHDKSPPSVMSSLDKQLHGLRDDHRIKDDLFRYLGHHAVNSDWQNMFQSAATRYLNSASQDIVVYGVLVRDLPPRKSDVSACAKGLAKNCPALTEIAVYGLYLPEGAISTLSVRAVTIAKGDEQ